MPLMNDINNHTIRYVYTWTSALSVELMNLIGISVFIFSDQVMNGSIRRQLLYSSCYVYKEAVKRGTFPDVSLGTRLNTGVTRFETVTLC